MQQEWKHLGSGSAIAIQQAQSTHSLRVRNEEDIKEVLRYSMLLVGLRGSNLPTEEEKFVLTNFVKSNFGNDTCEEIKLAFEMAQLPDPAAHPRRHRGGRGLCLVAGLSAQPWPWNIGGR